MAKSISKKSSKNTKNSKSKKFSILDKIRDVEIKDSVKFNIDIYPQSEEFTSAAACALMVLKFLNKNVNPDKEEEYKIWQEAVNGSIWYGSKYGLAYALAKRGADVKIISNTEDPGYEKKMAVEENFNLDALEASFNEIKDKAFSLNVEEAKAPVSINLIKKALSAKYIPILLVNASLINTYLDEFPHWVVVKGYEKDIFYINDPYTGNEVTVDAAVLKDALGFDDNMHMLLVRAKK
mgnify:CR=1 FL=1